MKKGFVKLIVYVAFVIITILVLMIANNLLERENILDRISEWPDLQVNTLEGEPVSTTSIPGDKPVMLYYFNTECIFCQGTFTDLPNHPDLMKDASLVFISDEDPGAISQFITEMAVDDLQDLLFFHDHNRKMKDFYAIRGVPAIYLYDQKGELTELFKGAVGIEQIRLELQKNNSSD